jgi:hypothetical protein
VSYWNSGAAEFFLAVDSLLTNVNKASELYWTRMGFTHSKPPQYKVESEGKRFAKVSVYEERGGRLEVARVYVFIDLNNGNVHKAATYKAAETTGKTKGVRTNIFAPDVLDKLTTFGTVYLTSGGCTVTIADELANAGK